MAKYEIIPNDPRPDREEPFESESPAFRAWTIPVVFEGGEDAQIIRADQDIPNHNPRQTERYSADDGGEIAA